MTFPAPGCKRFQVLLTDRENRFMEKHGAGCAKCRREEASLRLSLNMLRAAALDAAPPTHFDERLIRRVKVQKVKDSLNYWSPAFVGCALACVALFATLHVLTQEAPSNSVRVPAGQAFNSLHSFPELTLKHLPPFSR